MSRQDQQRKHIVRSVLCLCDGRSMAELSLIDVQVEADVSSSTLHHLFPTKRALIRAAYEQYIEDISLQFGVDTWESQASPYSPTEITAEFIRRYMRFCANNAQRATSLQDAVRIYPELSDMRNQYDRLAVLLIRDFLWQRIGNETCVDREGLEFVVWVIGAIGGRSFGPPTPIVTLMNSDIDSIIEHTVSLCLRALGLHSQG